MENDCCGLFIAFKEHSDNLEEYQDNFLKFEQKKELCKNLLFRVLLNSHFTGGECEELHCCCRFVYLTKNIGTLCVMGLMTKLFYYSHVSGSI